MNGDRIDVDRAVNLRQQGMTYRKIGEVLADSLNRSLPFHARSIYAAIKKYRDGPHPSKR